jgi:outer membrane protein OmpA-like peptidoglycan-associated protein
VDSSSDSTVITALPDIMILVLSFPNVNVIPYYYNEKDLDRIRSAMRSRNIELWHRLLLEYVSNFGIQNFYKDTKMIWDLAQLAQQTGHEQEAILFYKLVLKHNRLDIDVLKVQHEFDSISGYERDQYVPIDYYYDLVDYRKEVDSLQPPRGVLINMGFEINSEFSDYGPSLNVRDSILIFTSKRNLLTASLDNRVNEDLFMSRKDEVGWTEAEPFEDLNSFYNEGSACLSKDGNTMYFSRCNAPDTYGNCDLFMATLHPNGKWGDIKNLGTQVNSIAWDSHPSLSHTDDTLYFASDRMGGFGLSDIWFTIRDKKGGWGAARNAGPFINTRENEVSPFIHSKYNVLYFSSNGHLLNFGEFDIYKCYPFGEFWGEPKNIGPLINGEGSEFYFTIDADSKDLYYAKSIEQDMDNLDLYSFPLPMEAQPLATARLTGAVQDIETRDPFTSGIVSIIDLDNGIEIAPRRLSPKGTFEFDLINNSKYLIIIQSHQFFRIEEIFTLIGNTEINKYTQSITSRMEFRSIEFDNESSDLKPVMYGDLDKLGQFLLDNPDFKLKISGHTDSYGTQEYNIDLSKRRAQAIMDYIVYFGNVPRARIEAEGYGSTVPIITVEQSDLDRQINRRVEFELYRPSLRELEEMRMLEKVEKSSDW